jgi:hypothetical protein
MNSDIRAQWHTFDMIWHNFKFEKLKVLLVLFEFRFLFK